MKTMIIQPPYLQDFGMADHCFDYKLGELSKVTPDIDLVVLPEYSEVPVLANGYEQTMELHNKYFEALLSACKNTAKSNSCVIFFNALSDCEGEWRNTTFAIGKGGDVVGKYYKTHIPPGEMAKGIAYNYTKEYQPPYVLEIDGVKYGFLTCYDFYFYEYFPVLARENLDVIIGCSHQRSDTHEATEINCRFLAYNTNAYVVRSSISFDEGASVCGASMIVAPNGDVLANLKGKFGSAIAEFDPHERYLKPAGFGRPLSPHHEYIEEGRNPWLYRPAGANICRCDADMPYRRACAHRGFSAMLPENSLMSLGAAVSMGADEIEFDIWSTSDGKLVSMHDKVLDRVSDGEGIIYEKTYDELLKLDFGIKCGEKFKGMKIPTFEQILKEFSCRSILNIHIKIWDEALPNPMIEEIIGLVRKYGAEKHCYFMTTNDEIIKKVMEYAPDISVCVGHDSERPMEIVNRAIALGAKKVQLFKPYFNQEMIDLAHKHGIICNVFYADDEEEAKKHLDMGIDTILTNNYQVISQVVKGY